MKKSGIPQNCKILFVDDSRTEIKYLKLLFQVTGLPADPMFINSAHEALEILKNCSASDFPNFIIVDINMPLMDGFEFASVYSKELLPIYPNTKLFIYSTSIHSMDIQQAESIEGVTGFISKPFDETTFNSQILPLIESVDVNTISSPPGASILST